MAKEPRILLKIDVYPAKEDAALGNIFLVGPNGSIRRYQKAVMTEPTQRRRKRVVLHAGAAKHARSARREVRDLHCIMLDDWA